MCGSATLTTVESSTTISCAVAMTSSAAPRWRPLLLVPAWPAAEIVVAMPTMLPLPQPAVVVPGKRLLAAQRGYRNSRGYSPGSSEKWVPRAEAAGNPREYARRMSTERGGPGRFYAAGWVISAGVMLVTFRMWQIHVRE